mmetsp:Transcript_75948/g.180589  ORF Transcript_75948/g.180589 Transcript_75948/m.180589 type:complete len:328 (+) Transcript_75948:82-1065(+)
MHLARRIRHNPFHGHLLLLLPLGYLRSFLPGLRLLLRSLLGFTQGAHLRLDFLLGRFELISRQVSEPQRPEGLSALPADQAHDDQGEEVQPSHGLERLAVGDVGVGRLLLRWLGALRPHRPRTALRPGFPRRPTLSLRPSEALRSWRPRRPNRTRITGNCSQDCLEPVIQELRETLAAPFHTTTAIIGCCHSWLGSFLGAKLASSYRCSSWLRSFLGEQLDPFFHCSCWLGGSLREQLDSFRCGRHGGSGSFPWHSIGSTWPPPRECCRFAGKIWQSIHCGKVRLDVKLATVRYRSGVQLFDGCGGYNQACEEPNTWEEAAHSHQHW